MKTIKKYFQRKKYVLLFLGILMLIGLISGLIISITNLSILKESVSYYIENIYNQTYNYLLIHFFLLVLGFALSFIGIGIPFLCTMLFYEGLIFGFLVGMFLGICGLKGFLFSLIFFGITKGIFILLLIFFFLKCTEIARKMIGKFIYKTDPRNIIYPLMKGCGYLLILIVVNDLLILCSAKKIIPIFHFLLS